MRTAHDTVSKFLAGVLFFTTSAATGCSTGATLHSYTLHETMRVGVGASMISWTTRQGITKEFLYMGRNDNIVKIVYREYRPGAEKNLFSKDLVFSVAENYSADSKMYAVTVVEFEGLEIRIAGLEDDVIVFMVTSDHADLR